VKLLLPLSSLVGFISKAEEMAFAPAGPAVNFCAGGVHGLLGLLKSGAGDWHWKGRGFLSINEA